MPSAAADDDPTRVRAIRGEPSANDIVRVPRIVVTGSESTGKTTLAAQLAQALGTLWVPEFSRRYAEQVERALTAADVEPIARGQLQGEDEGMTDWRARFATQEAPPPLILDTDLVSTTVYARHYYGICPAWILTAARERRGDLYLLCATDLAWVADGVRDRERGRALLDAEFRGELRAVDALIEEVAGGGPQRLARALAAVERWARGA